MNIKDTVIAAVPDLEVFEKASRLFFFNLHIKEMSGLLVGEGNKVIVSKERKETNDQDDEDKRKGNTIKANSSCFKGGDLTVAGEDAKREKGGEQDAARKGPTQHPLRRLYHEVLD